MMRPPRDRDAAGGPALGVAPGRRPANDLLLRACRREYVERPPVWMMRQAGRYLPEYRAVRRRSDFLTMVRTPELAVEVTMQPVDLMGVDAAIIFSDILVVPQAMGMSLTVDEGIGPQFHSPIRSAADLAALRDVCPREDLAYMLDAVRLARHELDGRVPLIGFAGAPWTLAAYMVEGKGSKHFQIAKRMLLEAPAQAHTLLAKLAVTVGQFLVAQAEAGAQVLQLFDSWAGALAPAEFRQFALPYLARTAAIARTAGVPLIVFAPGAGWALEEIAQATLADVIGVDWQVDAGEARQRMAGYGIALQGNLDPCCLYAPPDVIRHRTRRMLESFGGHAHIANLGHGILPDIPVENARAFIDAVREWRSGETVAIGATRPQPAALAS
jgi:uroporphyrinogen decarboxylase